MKCYFIIHTPLIFASNFKIQAPPPSLGGDSSFLYQLKTDSNTNICFLTKLIPYNKVVILMHSRLLNVSFFNILVRFVFLNRRADPA
jgi:hypothetical protein